MIYADNAATTRISDSVLEKMLPYLCDQYGNASSQYSFGMKVRHAVEHARKQVAYALAADPSEIIFTSSGSEANNWVLRCVAEMFHNKPFHIITTSIEHHSVLNACNALEQHGIEVTRLPVQSTGEIEISEVEAAIKPHTKLVSIMFANNEIGTIQPIAEIGHILKKRGILFHTDAVQAVGHIPVDVSSLGVDFLTASAHKFNGAKGTGILYKHSEVELSPLILGGEQEHGLRAGTENVPGIVAAGYAIEESVNSITDESKRLSLLSQETIIGIKEKIPSLKVNGNLDKRLPGIINIGFDGVLGESVMNLLDLNGICVSTSSACTVGNGNPSHVLLALGLTERQARSAIRISYGRYNTTDDVKKIVEAINNAYKRIKENK